MAGSRFLDEKKTYKYFLYVIILWMYGSEEKLMFIDDPASAQERFRRVMGACGLFMAAMIGSLVYVCTRPQTDEVRAAEGRAVLACWQRSADAARTDIFRSEQGKACREMEKQYVHKFRQRP